MIQYLKVLIYIFFIFLAFINSISAQNENEEINLINIVAIVNDEAITLTDLINRLELIIITSGLKNNATTREHLSEQVLETLVNETLNSQEAKKLNIRASKLEINNTIAFIEKRNEMQPGTLTSTLMEKGLPQSALIEQIKSQIVWNKILRAVVKPRINISTNEINNELNILLNNEGQNEYRYLEIYLNFSRVQQKQNIINTANQLREQIVKSENFSEVALQMSQSTSAKNGGLVDWTLGSSIPKVIFDKIQYMSLKSISEPIVTNTGVYIIFLDGIRKFKIPNLSDTVLEIALIEFNIPKEKKEIQKLTSYIQNNLENVTSCEEITALEREDGKKVDSIHDKTLVNQLPKSHREILKNLKPNIPSKPFEENNKINVIMLCEQDIEDNKSYALKELVKNRIRERHFKMLSNRFILNLKRKALIDIRM